MSGFDEMLRGMEFGTKMFAQGMTQLGTQKAVNDATKQLQELNLQQLEEKERLAANQQVGNELALRLTAAGSSPDQIKAATDGLLPSAGSMAQVQGQERMSDKGQANQLQIAREHNESAERIAGIRGNFQKDKTQNAAESKFLKETVADFDKYAKKPMDALNQIQQAKAAIVSGNPIGDKSVTNFMARASGEVGALTEADKAPFGGSQALQAKISQAAENLKSGKFTAENRKLVSDLLNTFENTHKANLQRTRSMIAKRASVRPDAAGNMMTEEKIAQALYPDEPNSNQTKIDAAERLLADPKNANHPRKQELLMQIEKWKQGK